MARILLVEDSADVGLTLVEMLTRLGHHVDHSMTTYGAALRIAQPHEEYDLVLMDNFLSAGERGVVAALALRQAGYNGKIVQLTAIPIEIEPAIEARVNFVGVITKPVTLDSLRAQIDRFLPA